MKKKNKKLWVLGTILLVFIFILFFKETQFLKPTQDDSTSQLYTQTSSLTTHPLSPFRYYEENGQGKIVLDENFDFDSILRIKKKRNIVTQRKKLIEYIWNGKGLPKRIPDKIEEDIIDLRYETLNNLEKIDSMIIEMDYGVDSISYLLHPINPNNKLIVYQGGHSGDPINRNKTLQSFLDNGYTLLTFTMPLYGENSKPIIKEEWGKFIEHENFTLLDSDEFTSIKFFLEPIYVGLNYIEKNYNFKEIYMTGLSGGGWTTTVYSAIDTRIDKSYPIAGSLPLTYPAGRDYEQLISMYYEIADYLDLYIMGAYKRKQIQFLNSQDPCCFRGEIYGYFPYENKINKILSGDGEFKVHIESNTEHSITENVVNLILEDMGNS